MSLTLHLAKIIITNNTEPIVNGAILVEGSKIIQVGKKEDFGLHFPVIDHGAALISPGFINLHCHLAYNKKIDGSNGLFPWLEKLVDENDKISVKEKQKNIRANIDEAISSGTTFVVENTPSVMTIEEISQSPLKALIGLEVFGSDEEKADDIFERALDEIMQLNSKFSIPNSQFTFSPHAPYDVSKPLWEKLIQWSETNKRPLLTHLEESPQEKLWWKEKKGPATTFWKKINKLEPKIRFWKQYDSGIDFLNKNNLLSKNIIAAHLTQASKKDLKTLKEKNIRIVHCPRSNYYLNNGTSNIKIWDKLNLCWGIGTDSKASNESLNLLDELRFTINMQKIRYEYTISPKDAFSLITLNAARVLSKEKEIGLLDRGYLADFLVFDLQNNKSDCIYRDPYSFLIWELEDKKALKEVWINGLRAWHTEHDVHKMDKQCSAPPTKKKGN